MKTKQLRIDQSCLTGVNPKHTHGLGLWNNERVVVGIRVDKGLYNAFKPVALTKYGSVCNPIETFMATVVGAYKQEVIEGVNPSNTRIDIGSIIINRNTQERRKLTHTVSETKILEVEPVNACCVCGANPEFRVAGKLYCEADFWLQPKPGVRING